MIQKGIGLAKALHVFEHNLRYLILPIASSLFLFFLLQAVYN
jgi:hypothetical protein